MVQLICISIVQLSSWVFMWQYVTILLPFSWGKSSAVWILHLLLSCFLLLFLEKCFWEALWKCINVCFFEALLKLKCLNLSFTLDYLDKLSADVILTQHLLYPVLFLLLRNSVWLWCLSFVYDQLSLFITVL